MKVDPKRLAIASLALFASTFAVSRIANADATTTPPAATRPADDADVALVRDVIVKSLPKVKPEEVTATTTITDLGGKDISVMIILGTLGEELGTPIDDDAVERMVNTHPSKRMSDLTPRDLAQLVKQTRAAK